MQECPWGQLPRSITLQGLGALPGLLSEEQRPLKNGGSSGGGHRGTNEMLREDGQHTIP